ncbi:MAG: DRTGG domain-containing protein [Kiritimatiellales bacterium]
MKVNELKFDGLELLQPAPDTIELTGGYTSDLLSDVMANMQEGTALITIQAHKNTVAVAALTGASGIIFCSGRRVEQDVREAAAKENIALFVSSKNQYKTTVQLAKCLGE